MADKLAALLNMERIPLFQDPLALTNKPFKGLWYLKTLFLDYSQKDAKCQNYQTEDTKACHEDHVSLEKLPISAVHDGGEADYVSNGVNTIKTMFELDGLKQPGINLQDQDVGGEESENEMVLMDSVPSGEEESKDGVEAIPPVQTNRKKSVRNEGRKLVALRGRNKQWIGGSVLTNLLRVGLFAALMREGASIPMDCTTCNCINEERTTDNTSCDQLLVNGMDHFCLALDRFSASQRDFWSNCSAEVAELYISQQVSYPLPLGYLGFFSDLGHLIIQGGSLESLTNALVNLTHVTLFECIDCNLWNAADDLLEGMPSVKQGLVINSSLSKVPCPNLSNLPDLTLINLGGTDVGDNLSVACLSHQLNVSVINVTCNEMSVVMDGRESLVVEGNFCPINCSLLNGVDIHPKVTVSLEGCKPRPTYTDSGSTTGISAPPPITENPPPPHTTSGVHSNNIPSTTGISTPPPITENLPPPHTTSGVHSDNIPVWAIVLILLLILALAVIVGLVVVVVKQCQSNGNIANQQVDHPNGHANATPDRETHKLSQLNGGSV